MEEKALLIKPLSAKMRMFCEELMVDDIGKQAAIRAGYSIKTAEVKASQLLSLVKVKAYVSFLRNERAEKVGATAENVLRQLNTFRNARIDDYITIKSIPVTSAQEVVKESENEDEEPTVSLEMVTTYVQTVVFKDFKDLTDEQLSCIESVKMVKGQIELKLQGKDWTIEKVAKHIGFYEKDNRLTIDDEGNSEIEYYDARKESELEAEILELKAQLKAKNS